MAEVSISVRPRQQARIGFSAGLALANISLLHTSDRDLGRLVKDGVIVPIHGSAAPARIHLGVGRYVVSVSMPTGEQLMRELIVADDEPVSLVLGDVDGAVRVRVLAGIESASRPFREVANDAALQEHFAINHNSSKRAVAKSIEWDKPAPLLSVGRRTQVGRVDIAPTRQRPQAPQKVRSLVDLWSRRQGWRSPMSTGFGSGGLENWLTWLGQEIRRVPALRPEFKSVDVARFDLPRLDGHLTRPNLESDLFKIQPPGKTSQRYVCSVLPDGQVNSLAVAPWRWDCPEGPDWDSVSCFDEWEPERGTWRMRVDVQDPRMSSVLAYLTQGDLGSARMLLKSSLRMLMEKVHNPYAAAAGGYVLIYSKNEDIGAPDWPLWIRNLASWYPSSPDAQILMATLCLQRRLLMAQVNMPEVNGDVQRLRLSRILLKRALEAGIPMYSMGMRLLIENLEILNEEEAAAGLHHCSDELNLPETIRHVRAVSSCMKTVQPMTVLDFSDILTFART